MAVIIQCPHCQQKLEIDQDPSGMELECPVCNKKFSVQKDPVTPDPAAPAPAESVQPDNSGTFTFVCPSCRAAAELPVSLMGQKYECQMCFEEHVAQATPEKQCPYCGQTIKYHAMTCKYCGADLTKTPPRSESKTEKTFVFICPECKAVEFLPVSMKGQRHECKMCCETSVAQPAGERKCPHCGEKIKINALVCCHCNKKVKPLIPPFPGTSSPGQKFWGISERDAGFVQHIGTVLLFGVIATACISLLSAFLPLIIGMLFSPARGIVYNTWKIIRLINTPTGIVVWGIFLIWIYRLWKQVPSGEAEISPGKAIGFCFIPIFQIYWFIVMPLKLSRHYDQFNRSKTKVSNCWKFYIITVITSGAVIFLFYIAATLGNVSDRSEMEKISALTVILNSSLLLNWVIRLQKCLQNIPRIG